MLDTFVKNSAIFLHISYDAMMIVWRIRGKIIRTVLCWIVSHTCVPAYTHWYEHFLQIHQFSIRSCVCGFVFITSASLFAWGLVILS